MYAVLFIINCKYFLHTIKPTIFFIHIDNKLIWKLNDDAGAVYKYIINNNLMKIFYILKINTYVFQNEKL